MLEDRLLVWKFKKGNKDSFCRIYEKYRDNLLRLAMSFINETGTAEDVVHDVFVSFIHDIEKFRLTGSLKGYLATCVANRARNVNRKYKRMQNLSSNWFEPLKRDSENPSQWITCSEDLKLLAGALTKIPDNQRETIILHLQGGMKFREIAKYHEISIRTVQSRYRIGLKKLRSILNSQVEK